MNAVILSIGDELVLGQTVDTNSAFLSEELASRGIHTVYHQTVGDDQSMIADSFRTASQAASIVIATGGLGPTEDDLSRQALADALDAELVEHPESADTLRAFFDKRGRRMTANNLVQAQHPLGTEMIPNSCGTAPGIRAELNGATVYVTPGVPFEMHAMFEQSIAPELPSSASDDNAQTAHRFILTEKINTFGAGESAIALKIGDLMSRDSNPTVGTTVSDGIVSVRVRSEHTSRDEAGAMLRQTIDDVENKLGHLVFGRNAVTIQQSFVELLKERNLTVATAESCTGGMVAAMLTDVSGSSAVYEGGWITYSNEMKTKELGVDADIITTQGAVSEPVARAMAQGVIEQSGADLGVGITGIAGPTGGTPDKPVGTVWIGLAFNGGTEAMLFNLPGDRPRVRDRAAKCAIQLLRFHVLGIDLKTLSWGKLAES